MILIHSNSAEQETKAKLAKVDDIKKINAQMMAIKSEISKYEDTLKEYQLYKRFLESLTPKVCHLKYDYKKRENQNYQCPGLPAEPIKPIKTYKTYILKRDLYFSENDLYNL